VRMLWLDSSVQRWDGVVVVYFEPMGLPAMEMAMVGESIETFALQYCSSSHLYWWSILTRPAEHATILQATSITGW
jgi:hypothetical protein